jgi:putative hydrolase of the HAD superfamily
VFASSEIGWRKPAPQFFRTIQEQLGLSPHELLMVGDDLQLDIAAANRAGWQALHVPC